MERWSVGALFLLTFSMSRQGDDLCLFMALSGVGAARVHFFS